MISTPSHLLSSSTLLVYGLPLYFLVPVFGSSLGRLGEVNNNINESLPYSDDDWNPIVETIDGKVKGFVMKSLRGKAFYAFQSIPFAKVPVGALRFKNPVKSEPWEGIRDAIADSPSCVQADFFEHYNIKGQEDCLYLNVYTPQITPRRLSTSDKKFSLLPVMVFIHGGGFFFGSSSKNGPAYLLDKRVVMVSMNYRLGALGFLSTGDSSSPGNYGLKDQVMALKWVQANIEQFGGDPTRVTIFGESAGASSVNFHMVSKISKGLFHRGISQSGCSTCFWSISEQAPKIAEKFGHVLSCKGNSDELISCLRSKPAEAIVAGQLAFLEWTIYPVVIFGPVVEPQAEDAFLEELPEKAYENGNAADVPWISGFNADEGAINIALLFLNNRTLSQINEEWEKYGRLLLDLKQDSSNFQNALQSIKARYLGEDPISFSTRKKVIQMFSDRYTIACGINALNNHVNYSSQPTYAYQLSYRGRYSIVQAVGQNPKDWGVSHIDDLIYIVNNTEQYSRLRLDDDEYEMSKIILDLWANFAEHGEPFLTTKTDELVRIWEPNLKNQELRFLQLSKSPSMISNPYQETARYWRQLNLSD